MSPDGYPTWPGINDFDDEPLPPEGPRCEVAGCTTPVYPTCVLGHRQREAASPALDVAVEHFPFQRAGVLFCDCGWEASAHEAGVREWWPHVLARLTAAIPTPGTKKGTNNG